MGWTESSFSRSCCALACQCPAGVEGCGPLFPVSVSICPWPCWSILQVSPLVGDWLSLLPPYRTPVGAVHANMEA